MEDEEVAESWEEAADSGVRVAACRRCGRAGGGEGRGEKRSGGA